MIKLLSLSHIFRREVPPISLPLKANLGTLRRLNGLLCEHSLSTFSFRWQLFLPGWWLSVCGGRYHRVGAYRPFSSKTFPSHQWLGLSHGSVQTWGQMYRTWKHFPSTNPHLAFISARKSFKFTICDVKCVFIPRKYYDLCSSLAVRSLFFSQNNS